MKKLVLFSVLYIACSFIIKAQSMVWSKQMGSFAADQGEAVAVDSQGNVYNAGNFQNISDFDPGPGTFTLGSAGGDDIYLSKLDASGNFLWAVRLGGVGVDNCQHMTIDGSDNIYITGYFQGTGDFDPGPANFPLTSAGGNDVFVSKLDANGNFVWAKRMGGTASDMGISITTDVLGNVYTVGNFNLAADFDPGAAVVNLVSPGANDIFISKLNSAGNYVWAKNLSGNLDEFGNAIFVDAAGNVFTTGRFSGTTDFDPGAGTFNLSGSGSFDVFVSKLDASGNFVWAKKFGGTNMDVGYSLAVDLTGNIVVTGWFMGVVDFDPSAATYNMTSVGAAFDTYVVKFDALGNFIWAVQTGSSSNDAGQYVALDAVGNIYCTGYFQGAVDFDPGPGTFSLISGGAEDIYITKLDASGNFLWAKSFTGPFTDISTCIVIDLQGYIYTTGFFNTTVDFDPEPTVFNMTSSGGTEIFVHKMFSCSAAPSTPVAITGPTAVCAGSSNVYSIAPIAGAFSYTWNLPGSWSGLSSGNTISVSVNAASGTMSVSATNACGTSSIQTITINVSSIPATPGAIIGNPVACAGSANIFSIAPLPGATSYTWSLPGGWIGTSNTNTISITTNTVSGSIAVSAGNFCGNSSIQALNIFIHATPVFTSAINGNTIICSGSAATYSTAPVSSATSYFWSLPGGWTGSSTSNTISVFSGVASGPVSVIAGNICYNSLAQNINVTVNATPTITAISSNTLLCAHSGESATLTASGANSFTWNPGGAGTSIVVFPNSNTSYTIVGSNSNGCSDSVSYTQLVIPCTGLEDNLIVENKISVYPNPFTSKINIAGSVNDSKIIISNALGLQLFTSFMNGQEVEIDLEKYSAGIYFVHVTNRNNMYVVKIIKE